MKYYQVQICLKTFVALLVVRATEAKKLDNLPEQVHLSLGSKSLFELDFGE